MLTHTFSRLLTLVVMISTILFILWPQTAYACDCDTFHTLPQEERMMQILNMSDAAFVGQVNTATLDW